MQMKAGIRMAGLLTASVAAIGLMVSTGAVAADKPIIGLITKDVTNPFFTKMKEGAQEKATELGADFRSFAGKDATDNQGQVDAVENLVSAGAKGILLTPSDTVAMVDPVRKARAAGVLVIALDTALNPIDAADATFATDNFKAGLLIGQWAKATMGDKAKDAHIALIDENVNQSTVAVARDQGFMKGFGIDTKDVDVVGDETDPRISGHGLGNGQEEPSRTAMENLLQKDPDINLVYTINEPTAAGVYQAIKAAGKENSGILIVSVDGGCPGVKNVQAGIIGATSMQFPLLMASMGVEAVMEFAKTGKKPEPTPGLTFFDTGVQLISDHPAKGVDSISAEDGLKKCWG
jgi:fructose transport system substrate-binding protein